MSKPDNTTRELEKVLRSPEYRKKVKRMIMLVKTLRGIPFDKKIPKRKYLKAGASDKEKEHFKETDRFNPDIETIHYFCQTTSFSVDRRSAQPASAEQNLA